MNYKLLSFVILGFILLQAGYMLINDSRKLSACKAQGELETYKQLQNPLLGEFYKEQLDKVMKDMGVNSLDEYLTQRCKLLIKAGEKF